MRLTWSSPAAHGVCGRWESAYDEVARLNQPPGNGHMKVILVTGNAYVRNVARLGEWP